MQQRALARARCADDSHTLALRDTEIDAEQHRHLVGALAKDLAQPAAGDHASAQDRGRVIHTAAPPPG